jgi:hypothetical protein
MLGKSQLSFLDPSACCRFHTRTAAVFILNFLL